MRSTCAIASCLWALEVFLQLARAMLEGGAIMTMREEKKMNKDVILLCGECPTRSMYLMLLWGTVGERRRNDFDVKAFVLMLSA